MSETQLDNPPIQERSTEPDAQPPGRWLFPRTWIDWFTREVTAWVNWLITEVNSIDTDLTSLEAVAVTRTGTQTSVTGRQSAITTTALVTPAAIGTYRVTVTAWIEVAATTSSTLGPVTLTWAASPDATACAFVGSSSTANLAGTTITTSVLVRSATSAISYAIGYASVGATSLTYSVRGVVEAVP